MTNIIYNGRIIWFDTHIDGYSAFKLVMQGIQPGFSTTPQDYVEWSEVGMSWNNNIDRVGPQYFTVDSTAISGVPYGNGNPDKLFDGSTGGGGYDKFDASNFTAAEVTFHTNELIIPSSYNFYSCDNQSLSNLQQYGAPQTFTFYGKNEQTQQYDKLITVNASQLDMSNTSVTHITAEAPSLTGHIQRVLSFDNAFGYKTVKIGNQTWFAENLHDDDGQGGILTAHPIVNGTDLGTQYYYTWDAAVRIAQNYPGWHLATTADYNTLTAYAGANTTAACQALRSTSGWNNNSNGTNLYGYNCLPAGGFEPSNHFFNAGVEGTVWEAENHYRIYMLYNNTMVNGYEGNSYKFPIRLVKNS